MSSVSRSVGRPVSRSVLAGQSTNLTQLIKALFANQEQGFAYEPNDLTTLYQDAAGSIPVTAQGQPVGLMKDKSGRNNHAYQTVSASRPILQQTPILGANLLPTFDFTSWSTLGVDTSTTVKSFNVTYANGGVRLNNLFVLGKSYKLKAKLSTTATIVLIVNSDRGVAPLIVDASNGVVDTLFTATSDSIYLRTSTGTTTVSELEIKEITGYRTDQNYLAFDGVDDKLATTLPTQLTGCTVVRSVPNVGTQILTGQTIPTIYNDNIDNCGLIVINRALTASETSQITKLFNKAAGV